ncbi:WapI family immunity protein [Bacillus velezensis]|uniref:WapI family immunity protein n=1 Tax=Bacillus velezensis TaxID=492670 RepID=UPI003AFAF065
MAKIRDDCLELDITPRRYQEAGDDPFISTMFELLEHNKVIARDYSAALLESEYKMLISGIEALLAGNQDRIRLETIEPFFILSIDKENEYYRFIIRFVENHSNTTFYKLNCNEEKLEFFVKTLKSDLKDSKTSLGR